MHEDLSHLVRRFRIRAGLSQADLAERAGLSVAAIGTIERGTRRHPHQHTLRALADGLGLKPAERQMLLAALAAKRSDDSASPAPDSQPLLARSLPDPPTQLIGREMDVRAAVALLQPPPSARLATLIGPGGVGKTRLALAIAREVQAEYADGAVFVDLSPLRDQRLVAASIAGVLELRDTGGRTARELLRDHLRKRQLLLVLDNFEHLVVAASMLAQLVEDCAQLTILVTSRVALRVRAEQRLVVAPLLTPVAEAREPEVIGAASAVGLFVDRARAIVPDFALTRQNAEAVAAICRRLDGLPLALELAAAQAAVLEPDSLLHRLERRLPLLVDGPADLPRRQRTLRQSLAWSYELLAPEQQALFRRLAVFSGGWTAEAADAVCPDSRLKPSEVLDALRALLDSSLVRRADVACSPRRFDMLDTLREYGLERLAQADELQALYRQHRIWCIALIERVPPEAWNSRHLAELHREHANMHAALESSHAAADADAALRLAVGLAPYWYARGTYTEGRSWLGRVLALEPSQPTTLRARALVWDGQLARSQGDFATAEARLDESVATAAGVSNTKDAQTHVAIATLIRGHIARDGVTSPRLGRCIRPPLPRQRRHVPAAWRPSPARASCRSPSERAISLARHASRSNCNANSAAAGTRAGRSNGAWRPVEVTGPRLGGCSRVPLEPSVVWGIGMDWLPPGWRWRDWPTPRAGSPRRASCTRLASHWRTSSATAPSYCAASRAPRWCSQACNRRLPRGRPVPRRRCASSWESSSFRASANGLNGTWQLRARGWARGGSSGPAKRVACCV